MPISDTSYDRLQATISAFASLDYRSRMNLYEELRCMLSHALEVQRQNEVFKARHYSHYALLESDVEAQRAIIEELEAENAELGAQNARLEILVNQLTPRTSPATNHGLGAVVEQ